MAALIAFDLSDREAEQLPMLALAIAGWCTAAGFGLVAIKKGREAEAASLEAATQSHRSLAAETANAAKSRYLANVSHEIRSPLNAIYGYAQLIERSDNQNAREAARVIKRSTEHLITLIEGLLDISLLENGMMRIRSDQVSLREFIDQTCWMMRPDAQAKDLDFRVELTGRIPELVRTDQSRLRQVLINLLSNAIKFTDRGSVTLKVRYSNQIAVFEVFDTGPGIQTADRERIFIPFERGEAEDQQRRPGVGLGLPITKAIVEILGGQIEVESEPGIGTCFRVTLMLGEVAGAFANAALRPATPVTALALDGRGRSILLVDDDPQQLSFMKALLAAQGFAVTAVPDGETAVCLCRQASFDLAMLDINLPGISGWETGHRVRELLGRDIRILMLSGNLQEAPKGSVEEPIHDRFLAKPVEFNALLEAVGELLEIACRPAPMPGKLPALHKSEGANPRALPHITRIREFLSIGHYRGVESALGELAEDVPEASDLVAFLLEKLDRFDLAAMARKLEAY
ncbi:hybrid sensor histidine kinase/response regulator [Croceibacterium selenioxidans]|nr:ATP-binding protein [Croceibacterium selenioxidans]